MVSIFLCLAALWNWVLVISVGLLCKTAQNILQFMQVIYRGSILALHQCLRFCASTFKQIYFRQIWTVILAGNAEEFIIKMDVSLLGKYNYFSKWFPDVNISWIDWPSHHKFNIKGKINAKSIIILCALWATITKAGRQIRVSLKGAPH